jgi:hypothetical protein
MVQRLADHLVDLTLSSRSTCRSRLPFCRRGRSAHPGAALRPPVEGPAHGAARRRPHNRNPVAAAPADARARLHGLTHAGRVVPLTTVVRDLGEYQGSACLRIGSAEHLVSSSLSELWPACGSDGSYASIEAKASLLPRFIWVIRNTPAGHHGRRERGAGGSRGRPGRRAAPCSPDASSQSLMIRQARGFGRLRAFRGSTTRRRSGRTRSTWWSQTCRTQR